MNSVYIIAARRTAVVPRGGAFAQHEVYGLGSRVIEASLCDSGLSPHDVDNVVMGNALYGGGNPARLAALAAGLPETVPAMTIDTQCCAGLDAINTACSMVAMGAAQVVVAGGLESYSRAPIRQHRPKRKGDEPIDYVRPPFTPWPRRDPDMLESASELARRRGVSREMQAEFAILSHKKALEAASNEPEIAKLCGVHKDLFTRKLSPPVCARAAILSGDSNTGLTAATVAVEADAAAAVVVVSEEILKRTSPVGRAIGVITHCSVGSDPSMPSTAPIAAVEKMLRSAQADPSELRVAEVMEAFAVQAMVCIGDCRIDPASVNRGGGALSRGHPIGASGAILGVRLWSELQSEESGALGIATIAAAGGLGSAALWKAQ